MHGKQFRIFDRLVDIQESYFLGTPREQSTATRAKLRSRETGITQTREQPSDHNSTRVGRIGKVFRTQRLVTADRQSGQHVNSDGKASTGGHRGL
ncbi:hypothetical protein R69749_08270 [Paraburkholderia domus]|nr:hypothetical protein R69749_08270 [Paraburkholderia domus]